MSSVALVSFARLSSSHRRPQSGAPSPSFKFTPSDPVRLSGTFTNATIPSRAYTIGIFLVAPAIPPLPSSSSSRLVQERQRGHRRPGWDPFAF